MRQVVPLNAKLVPPQATRVFKGIIYDVYHWQQKMFDDSDETFEMLKRPDTVQVLAVKDDKLVILDQEQPNHEPFYSTPGGRHDNEDESELDAAKREMLEETGMRFKTWRLLDCTQPHAKIEQFIYIFLATDFESQAAPKSDNGEKIELKFMTLDQVKALLDNPKSRYLPKDLLGGVDSLEELMYLPAFEGK